MFVADLHSHIRGTDCHYDTDFDSETHSQALKRKYSELQNLENAQARVYELLRDRPYLDATAILQRIRNGASPQAIIQQTEHGDLLLQLHLKPETKYRYDFPYISDMPALLTRSDNPYVNSLIFETPWPDPSSHITSSSTKDATISGTDAQAMYLRPYHSARLVEPLLADVKVSTWTNVSADETFLHSLLETYLIHNYPYFALFQKDSFLRDMKARRHRFCSALLVNAIMASVCHSSMQTVHQNEFWKPTNLEYLFVAESRRLLDLEASKTRITTVQALLILGLVINEQGMDKVGVRYFARAVDMAKAMGVFTKSDNQMSEEMRTVRELTAWSTFNSQALVMSGLFMPPLLAQPPQTPLPDPLANPSWYGELLVQYPGASKPISTLHPQTFYAMSEFRVILNEITLASFASLAPKSMSMKQALDFYDRLRAWYTGLPSSLGPTRAVLPDQLKLQYGPPDQKSEQFLASELDPDIRCSIQYWAALMSLFEHLVPPTPAFAHVPNPETSALQIRSEARVHLETVIRIYYLRHGFEFYDPTLVLWLAMFGFISVNECRSVSGSEDAKAARSTLILICKGLSDQARNFFVVEGVLRLVCAEMAPQDLALLKQYTSFSDIENPSAAVERMSHIQSDWPMNIVSVVGVPDPKRSWRIIEGTDELETDSVES
ncbi:MAG: hypothetical protein M1821_007804 [Bathelium mastoideum]|nr:MAG: hypothetical protein M1821_007804 [Bathelium mastoideum]